MPRNFDEDSPITNKEDVVKAGAKHLRWALSAPGDPFLFRKQVVEKGPIVEKKFYRITGNQEAVILKLKNEELEEATLITTREYNKSVSTEILLYNKNKTVKVTRNGPRVEDASSTLLANVPFTLGRKPDECSFSVEKKRYYNNGKIREKATVERIAINNSHDFIKKGPYTQWYKNGNKKLRSYYKRNRNKSYSVAHGIHNEYYSNGAIRRRIELKNGRESGWETNYGIDGSISSSVLWTTGKNSPKKKLYAFQMNQDAMAHKDFLWAKEVFKSTPSKIDFVKVLVDKGITQLLALQLFKQLSTVENK